MRCTLGCESDRYSVRPSGLNARPLPVIEAVDQRRRQAARVEAVERAVGRGERHVAHHVADQKRPARSQRPSLKRMPSRGWAHGRERVRATSAPSACGVRAGRCRSPSPRAGRRRRAARCSRCARRRPARALRARRRGGAAGGLRCRPTRAPARRPTRAGFRRPASCARCAEHVSTRGRLEARRALRSACRRSFERALGHEAAALVDRPPGRRGRARAGAPRPRRGTARSCPAAGSRGARAEVLSHQRRRVVGHAVDDAVADAPARSGWRRPGARGRRSSARWRACGGPSARGTTSRCAGTPSRCRSGRSRSAPGSRRTPC